MEPRAAQSLSPSAPASHSTAPGASRSGTPRRRPVPVAGLGFVLALSLLAAGAPRAATAAPDPEPDAVCDTALYHRLDVLLGDWRVVGAGGETVGKSRVERLHGGCVVQETWEATEDGVTGEGVSYVDPVDNRWRQIWIDSTGAVSRLTQWAGASGDTSDGALHFAGIATRPDGAMIRARMSVWPLGDGTLHEVIEHSLDGGVTWEAVFDVTYEPAAGAGSGTIPPTPAPAPGMTGTPPPHATPPPAPMQEPSAAPPAPDSAPTSTPERGSTPAPSSGSVRASSGVVPQKDVPLERRNRIFLESPMVLELPIGPIESIPEEYSWSSKDTSVYECGGVSVRRVTLSRKEHGKQVDVEAVAALYSNDFLTRLGMTAELVWHGEVLAKASADKIAVGRSIQAQSEGDGLKKRFTLTVDRSRFEQAFGDTDERPVLRLTVTVRN